MSMHPTIVREMAEQHHRELVAQAEAYRRARAATEGQPTAGRAVLGWAGGAARTVIAVISRMSRARRPLPDEA